MDPQLQHGYQEKSKNHHASLKYVYVDFRFIVDTVTYILKPLVYTTIAI